MLLHLTFLLEFQGLSSGLQDCMSLSAISVTSEFLSYIPRQLCALCGAQKSTTSVFRSHPSAWFFFLEEVSNWRLTCKLQGSCVSQSTNFPVCFVLDTESGHPALPALKLTVQIRLASNLSCSSWLCLLSTEMYACSTTLACLSFLKENFALLSCSPQRQGFYM